MQSILLPRPFALSFSNACASARAHPEIPGLCVPLCCIVDLYGIRFLCHAIAPLDARTLASVATASM